MAGRVVSMQAWMSVMVATLLISGAAAFAFGAVGEG